MTHFYLFYTNNFFLQLRYVWHKNCETRETRGFIPIKYYLNDLCGNRSRQRVTRICMDTVFK